MKTRAFIFIVIAGILWGTSPLFSDYLRGYGFLSVQMTAARSVVTAVVLALYILIFKRSAFKVGLVDLLIFALAGISYVGTATFYYESMARTSSATAVVLMYIAPIIVMIYSVLFSALSLYHAFRCSVILQRTFAGRQQLPTAIA